MRAASFVRESDGADAFSSGINPVILKATGTLVTNGLGAAATTVIAGVVNQLNFMPFIPTQTITVAQLQAEVTTLLAASNMKLGVYASAVNGTPAALIVGSADISCATIGVKAFAITGNQVLVAGTLYWLAVHFSSTQSLKALPLASMVSISADFNIMRMTQTYASGLPASGSTAVATNSIAPRVLMQLA